MELPVRLCDRSRVVQDWKCPRSRYWGYEYKGKGIAKDNLSLELFLGTMIHDALAGIATQQQAGNVDINGIAATAQAEVLTMLRDHANPGDDPSETETFAQEQAALVEGLIRGFYRQVWTNLMAQYPTIRAVEQEMVYPHDNVMFMAKPDLVVEDRDHNLWYMEYKSTSSKKADWINSWNTAVQLHSTIRAIEHTFGEKVTGVIVQGLYKGYISYGKQSSPFCYAYLKSGNPPFTDTQTAYEYKAGFKRSPTWELDGGVAKWVDDMPESVLTEQFPQTPPIFVKDDLVDAFFAQQANREFEIQQAMLVIEDEKAPESLRKNFMNGFFQQHWESCSPAYGRGCPFKGICHGNVPEPLKQGWILRQPHHKPEEDQQKGEQ